MLVINGTYSYNGWKVDFWNKYWNENQSFTIPQGTFPLCESNIVEECKCVINTVYPPLIELE